MSTIWVPMLSTGLSEVMGSWNTMEIRSPRMARISAFDARSRSLPSKRTSPAVIRVFSARRRITAPASVDLPEPLSPTTPTTDPAGTSRSTLRSAFSGPRAVENSTLKARTSSSTPLASLRTSPAGLTRPS